MLKLFKATILLWCAFGVSVVFGAITDSEAFDCYIVPHSRISLAFDPDVRNIKPWDFELTSANWGHEIEPSLSSSSVIGVRKYAKNGDAVDSQNFSKLTIEMVGEVGVTKIGGVRPLRSFYTSGSVGFVGRGEFSKGMDIVSGITLLDGNVIAIRIGDSSVATAIKTHSISCSVRIIEVHDLNFWQGRVGGSWPAFNPPSYSNDLKISPAK